MRLLAVALSLGFVLADSASAAPAETSNSEAEARSQLIARAASIATRLQSGSLESVADEFHYPSSYTEQQRVDDRKIIRRQLAVLTQQFGELETFTLTPTAQPFYRIAVGSVSNAYWDNLPNEGISAGVSFNTTNKKISRAVLAFTFYFTNQRFELRSIEFGLGADQPNAQERMAAIGIMLDTPGK